MILPSRRNLVRTVEWNGRTAVRKLFNDPADWQRELDLLRLLGGRIPAPGVLVAAPGILLTEYLPHPTLLDELERQEREGFSPAPWLALRQWIERVCALTGLLPGDGNLRNFLWDGSRIHGLDFEGYAQGAPAGSLAQIAAYILEYHPRDTLVKRRAARCLFDGSADAARLSLIERRRKKADSPPELSFILLAGGKSTRMGRDKASLPFFGTSLLQLQLDKARLMGCGDILISGADHSADGAKTVPDVYPDRGPLGGLHACLREAKHTNCIVLGADMPLLPPCELRALAREHASSGAEITLAVHSERWEPLAGVYNSALADRIAPMIEHSGAPVRALIQKSDCRFRQSPLSEEFWINCNTPEAYASITGG